MRLTPYLLLLYRSIPRPPLIMDQRWSLTRMMNATAATLKVGSPKEECRRHLQATSVLSQSWSCSYDVNDFAPMLDMEREFYGGSNESLAEKVLSVEELSSQEESPSEPSLDEQFVLADLTTEDEEDSNEDEAAETVNSPANPSPPQEKLREPSVSSETEAAAATLPPMKPPNILIFTGADKPGEDFARIKHRLQKCLDPDAYLVYFLAPNQLARDPWKENTALLVLYCQDLDPVIRKQVIDFFQAGGRCLNFFWGASSSMLAEVQTNPNTNWQFVVADTVHSLLRPHLPRVVDAAFCQSEGSRLLLYQQDLLDGETDYPPAQERRLEVLRLMLARKLGLQCAKRPQESRLTPGYFLHGSPGEKQAFLTTLGSRRELPSSAITLELMDNEPPSNATATRLPVSLAAPPSDLPFNHSLYFHHLHTRALGRTLLYSPVVTTTMDIVTGLTQFPGAVVIASRQTQGKGRGGNAWLSPEGCAMFTLNLPIALHSNLGHHLPFLQHLVSVAMVHALRSSPHLMDVDLRLKWPNDIYWGRKVKMGGLVVRTTLVQSTFQCHVGCGLNVSNARPTQCLRDVLEEAGQGVSPMGVEEYIARTLTQVELLLDSYQDKGPQDLCLPLYYKYWVHGGQKVTLGQEGGQEAVVEGIDDYGFLLVRTAAGQNLSLQPDGNSFDLLKNLITIKAHH